jgi:hypothetical protein
MFRVQLASGEEAAFRTVEELALAIQSGIITPEARLHVDGGGWRPITESGAYEEAQGLVATLAPIESPEPAAPILPTPELSALPSTARIYRMFSRSAQELAERHRPRWIMRTAAGTAILLLLIAVVALPRRPGPVRAAHGPAVADPEGAPTPPAGDTTDAVLAGRPPFDLAQRWNRWTDSTNRMFADSARQLGLDALLSRSRLVSAESLRVSEGTLAAFRQLLDHFRAAQVQHEQAYWDSALALEQSGVWSPTDLEEWRTRTPHQEPPLASARADSLNRTLNLLVEFLLAEQGQYDLSGDLAHFSRPEAGQEYDRLRSALTLNADTHGLPAEHPLSVLLEVVRRNPLPPRSN